MSRPSSMSPPHSRHPSSDSTSSAGSSYHYILEHILSSSTSYELPLRTMYTLNCAPRAQPPVPGLLSGTTTPTSHSTSPITPTFSYQEQQAAAAQFTSNLMNQLAQLPAQPCSLPPAFVTSFLNRCFPMELAFVEFPQALTALDYLKDLESRRRKELQHALSHLGISQEVLHQAGSAAELARLYPTSADWVLTLEQKEKRADALYTQLYVALRRWILINEMKLEPFNKPSCLAMLNTLYPPVVLGPPTSKLTTGMLLAQRDGFFKYIRVVEKQGPTILDGLIAQGAKDGDETGWPAVKRTLTNYLALANTTIEECQEISRSEPVPASFSTTPAIPRPTQLEARGRSKTDSGISFGEAKHMKNVSTSSSKSGLSTSSRSTTASEFMHRASALERLARELKKMRPRNRVTVEEIIPPPTLAESSKENSPKSRFGTLKKMRSLGALSDLKHSNSSSTSLRTNVSSAVPAYDAHAMKRQREEYERRNRYI